VLLDGAKNCELLSRRKNFALLPSLSGSNELVKPPLPKAKPTG